MSNIHFSFVAYTDGFLQGQINSNKFKKRGKDRYMTKAKQ